MTRPPLQTLPGEERGKITETAGGDPDGDRWLVSEKIDDPKERDEIDPEACANV